MKKAILLLTILAASVSFGANYTIQVQSTQKQWKIKNGAQVVATQSSNPGTTGSANIYMSSRLPNTKINGNVQLLPTPRFIVSAPQGIVRTYFTGPNCTGQMFISIMDLQMNSNIDGIFLQQFFDGIEMKRLILYMEQNTLLTTQIESASNVEGGVCSDRPETLAGYKLNSCTLATCGFDGDSQLSIEQE